MAKSFKIILINPAYACQVCTTTGDVHQAMERKPPLGILSIGTYLKKNTDFEIKLLDNQLEALKDTEIPELIKDFQPDVVGISVVSFKLYSAYRLTQVIKKTLPSAHVCWGGPHLSIFPRESLHLPGVDSIVLGDGEIPFSELCKNLSNDQKIEDIPGVYNLNNEPDAAQFKEYFCPDLNALPLLDLTLLPYRKYRAFLTNNLMATLITSRGCPFHCIFCKLSFSKVRLLSIDKVIQQIESYLTLGIKEIEFYDETFNINSKRVMEFAGRVIKKKLKFRWSFRGRVDAASGEMLKLAKQAGCQRIQYGVEAGTDRVLKILKKETTVDQIKSCFRLTRKSGIDTIAYFILGNPQETLEEMRETMRLAREIRPTYLEYAIFNISPGTESYLMAQEQGLIQQDYWRQYAGNPTPDMPVLAWAKDYTYHQLQAVRQKALRDFYIRPGYILNRIMRIRPKEAYRVFKTGTGVMKDIFRPGARGAQAAEVKN